MEFKILGPLEVRTTGVPLPLGGPKQRALLAHLLLRANSVVARDALIDALWGEKPPATAPHTLDAYVHRLRKLLSGKEDGEPRLVTRAPGYLLRVAADELDADRFQRLLDEGRRALHAGAPELAAERLVEALATWRGPPLADLEPGLSLDAEVRRLEEVRLAAVEDRIEAELALGRDGALVPELESLLERFPLRERLREQLMLSLYRAGRQAEALATYREGHTVLRDELGLEPGPAMRRLEQAILEQDPALELHDPQPSLASPGTGSGPTTHRHRWRAPWIAAAALVVGALVAITSQVGSSSRPSSLTGNVLVLVSPDEGRPTASVPLRAAPADVASGFGSLWVTEPGLGAVVRIDTRRRVAVATIPVGTRPSRIIAAAGDIWVLDRVDRSLSRIDPSTETVAQTIGVGRDPTDVVAGDRSLWIADHGDDTVVRIDPRSGRTQGLIRTKSGPRALAVAGGTLWVADDQSGRVERLDVATGRIIDSLHVGDAPSALAASGMGLWVLDPLDATLSRVDTRRDVVNATIAVTGRPEDLTVRHGSVWVLDGRQGALLRISPQRSAVIDSVRLGGHPRAVDDGAGTWVAVEGAGPSHRGGTLTTIPLNREVDSIDPAASNSLNTPPPQLLGMTNDGLVTLDHAAGPDRTRLVPDLALALPVPAAHARVYTFRLRPAIRYSTGQLVKPSDVTHSFERIFSIGSSAADYYEAIVGARECSRHRAACDLSRGIVADDRARTVTFHLSHPDPDFLYKLTLAYADVLPASTPGREARAPLPATGPYVISRFLPRHELRLTRNPHFREWSAAAQPDGYPDRIVLRLGRTAATSGAGGPDLTANVGGLPRNAASVPAHDPNRVRVNPVSGTAFLFLNVGAPPFNDRRVRQALNFALDRGRISKLDGGSLAAQPTCQILPPQLPGYRRFCPYTRGPTGDGRWHGPDLARGRRLVRASRTLGMRVTVWDTRVPQFVVNEGRVAVAALRRLGYRARLRMLPDSTFFTYTNDSRNRAQVIDGGWSLDYPSANDLIGKLSCRYFEPGNGPATTDGSEFCDPAIDKRIARASVLQTTDLPAAAERWTRLDRELTRRAIWLPTVTLNETDLVSRRAGNYQYNPLWGPLADQLWVR